MLIITVSADEIFDESSGKFSTMGGFQLELEHSLISLSKWESEFEKPFLGDSEKTPEELLAYINAMVLTKNPPGDFLEKLSSANISEIHAYIDKKMTATWFSDSPGAPATRTVITAELIYYWMIQFEIDFECQYWHLNRLFTLIQICNVKAAKPTKMSRTEIAARNRALNKQRQQQFGTKG